MWSSVELLTSFGITTSEICNDVWVLRYNNEIIKNRFEEAKRHNIETMKTWMVRATTEIFHQYVSVYFI